MNGFRKQTWFVFVIFLCGCASKQTGYSPISPPKVYNVIPISSSPTDARITGDLVPVPVMGEEPVFYPQNASFPLNQFVYRPYMEAVSVKQPGTGADFKVIFGPYIDYHGGIPPQDVGTVVELQNSAATFWLGVGWIMATGKHPLVCTDWGCVTPKGISTDASYVVWVDDDSGVESIYNLGPDQIEFTPNGGAALLLQPDQWAKAWPTAPPVIQASSAATEGFVIYAKCMAAFANVIAGPCVR